MKRIRQGEKDEFDIPSKIIHPCSIVDNNNYDPINSRIISDYLKSTSELKSATDKIYWKITNYDKSNSKIKVKGFTTVPAEYELIEYGKEKHLENFNNYYNKFIKDNTKPKTEYLSIFNNTFIGIDDNDKILYFHDIISPNNIKKYDELLKKDYYIYYLKENINNTENSYIIGDIYEFSQSVFMCIKITPTYKSPQLYTISFIYIHGSILQSKSELIRYGQEKHIENVKQHHNITNISDISNISDEQKTSFNIIIAKDNKYDIEKFLYYYELANDDGIKAYNNLNNEGYFIYTLIETNVNKYEINRIYPLYNTRFECINIYNKLITYLGGYSRDVADIDIKIIVFKYIGNGLSLPVITGGGQRKYKRLNFY